jgi:phage shock protein PspC (stress-responsive transcriptional regulator)
MACVGIASNLEDDPGLVWLFRIVGGIMAGIAIYYMVSAGLHPPRG